MAARLSHGRPLLTEGFGIDQSELPPFDEGRLDPRGWFPVGDRPLHLEIGSGKGTFLVQQARERPDVNYLGVELAAEFYRYAADRIRRWDLDNARMLRANAVEFVRFWCADEVFHAVHVYFSDPWPKAKHHKRRVIQDASLRELHRVLVPGGELHLVTDHPDLWSWYEAHADRHGVLFARRPFAPPASAGAGELVGTNYERKFAREGRPFFGMTLVKK